MRLEKAKVVEIGLDGRTFSVETFKTRRKIQAFAVTPYRSITGLSGFLYLPKLNDTCLVLYDEEDKTNYIIGFYAKENLLGEFPVNLNEGDTVSDITLVKENEEV